MSGFGYPKFDLLDPTANRLELFAWKTHCVWPRKQTLTLSR